MTEATTTAHAVAPKPKKSVALSGVTAGNTALCTVGRTGNDLHYRGYDILDISTTCEFEEIAYLLVHGKLPNVAELTGYKRKLQALRGIPLAVKLSPFYTSLPNFVRELDQAPGLPVHRIGRADDGEPERAGA